jgi:signal transduction histidine kinase
MNLHACQKVCLGLALSIFAVHLTVAAIVKPWFALMILGDAISSAMLVIAIFGAASNFRRSVGILPLFWKLMTAGLFMMLASQICWFYYHCRRQFSASNPVPADSLFLLAHVFFLSALALRPHSASAGRDLRIRRLDFALLTVWWLALYGYFCLPWINAPDLSRYNPNFHSLAFLQRLAIIGALVFLRARNAGLWRRFYGHYAGAFVLLAAGNLVVNWGIDRGLYHAGGFFDTTYLLALVCFVFIASFGPSLDPKDDTTPNRELIQGVWTSRIAMLAILSIPVIAALGLFAKNTTPAIELFRLRLVFGAMFLLGALVYWKLNLLAHELVRLVHLTHDSIENLKSVEQQVSHAQKLAALGRLAAGAAHEISNPLTAILGYAELLVDIPSLSPEDRTNAKSIQQQVHRAQAAVVSLRNTLRQNAPATLRLVDEQPAS